MDRLEKAFSRLSEDLMGYMVIGDLEQLDGVASMLDFFIDEVGGENLAMNIINKKLVKKVVTTDIPKQVPLFVDESFYAYQTLVDFYYAIFKEKIITEKQFQEMLYLLHVNKRIFVNRMSNPDFWSKQKLALMDELLSDEKQEELEFLNDLLEESLENTLHENESNVVPFPVKKQAEKIHEGRPLYYQIRVDLKGYKPPIWRRLLIPTGITYANLHEIMQIAFEWSDEHLHNFFVGRTLIIGPNNSDITQISEEERLIDEDFHENATINYIYDFGDYWEHQIKVEKVFFEADQAEPIEHAICLKAKGDTPIENSRGQEIWEPVEIESINEELAGDYSDFF